MVGSHSLLCDNFCTVCAVIRDTHGKWWAEQSVHTTKHVPRGGWKGANMCLMVGGKELTCASWWVERS